MRPIPLDSGSLGGVFLLALGGVLLVSGLRRRARHRALVSRSKRATGVVVALGEVTDDEGDTMYRPVVRFTDDAGATRDFRAATASRPARYRVGEEVPVFYPAEDPTAAGIVGEAWLIEAITLVLFGALAALGATLLVVRL